MHLRQFNPVCTVNKHVPNECSRIQTNMLAASILQYLIIRLVFQCLFIRCCGYSVVRCSFSCHASEVVDHMRVGELSHKLCSTHRHWSKDQHPTSVVCGYSHLKHLVAALP